MKINGEEHSDLCVGIDLGTTNSVLAAINVKPNGDIVSKVVDLPRAAEAYVTASGEPKYSSKKEPTLPSCVFYDAARKYETVVGNFAKTMYSSRPDFVAKSIKSQMGEETVRGLADGIPDKTPAEVSARILRHMLQAAEKIYRTSIKDAVITVPANFDSVMCKATYDAAELAGITVRNQDGSERPVLLSEPNAVIWDFINQVKNGEISGHIIDLSSPKDVMVFDLGGGTLDITLHHISRKEDNAEILKVDEIATNRYTLLGGDDFDNAIARRMYERYAAKNQRSPDAAARIARARDAVMSQLRGYAEGLKLDLSSRHSTDYVTSSGWDDDEEDEAFDIGGNIAVTGYAYDDRFSTQEIEEILRPFMGEGLSFEDYKRMDSLAGGGNSRNIIFPILDVLGKAAKKLGSKDVNVDAVILNGGMTKFYMVVDRLRDFFGFEPVSALDPDQAVARGAAVYHYYLHKYEALREDMRRVGLPASAQGSALVEEAEKQPEAPGGKDAIPVEWGKSILNDSLYLGMKSGVSEEIVPTGAELPYSSAVRTGFRLSAGADHIAVPIQRREYGGLYRTIASGKLSFRKAYKDDVYVAFSIQMSASKIITMKAWTSEDPQGTRKIEEGVTEIAVNIPRSGATGKQRIRPPLGASLNPVEEMHRMRQLCDNFMKTYGPRQSKIAKEINGIVASICAAANKADFAFPLLKSISATANPHLKMRSLTIARRICREWPEEARGRLAKICLDCLKNELHGVSWSMAETTPIKEEAIRVLAFCGAAEDMDRLEKLHDLPKLRASLTFAHSRTGTQTEWLLQALTEDVRALQRRPYRGDGGRILLPVPQPARHGARKHRQGRGGPAAPGRGVLRADEHERDHRLRAGDGGRLRQEAGRASGQEDGGAGGGRALRGRIRLRRQLPHELRPGRQHRAEADRGRGAGRGGGKVPARAAGTRLGPARGKAKKRRPSVNGGPPNCFP